MKQAKALVSLDGLLTINRIYTILYENTDPAKRPFYTVVDDRGVQCTYSADRFEIIHTPKGSPDFSEMQQIASEVKITCPVVEAYEASKTGHDFCMADAEKLVFEYEHRTGADAKAIILDSKTFKNFEATLIPKERTHDESTVPNRLTALILNVAPWGVKVYEVITDERLVEVI